MIFVLVGWDCVILGDFMLVLIIFVNRFGKN